MSVSLILAQRGADSERSVVDQWEESIQARVLHPQDVATDDLADADVVLIDYRLDHWPERDNLDAISLKPLDGLALASVLRAHADGASEHPVAIAIRSAHLIDIAGRFPPEPRLHILAQTHNLEWVFSKSVGSGPDDAMHQVSILAAAVRRLPMSWPTDNPNETRRMVEEFMAIPDELWAGDAWQDIEACHPPVHELVEGTHGLAFIRWILHRILPYPCFLSDTHRLAARLRVTHESLLQAFHAELNTTMEPFLYKGGLAGFLGPRWWRCGVESFLWDLTNGNPFDPQSIRELLCKRVGRDFVPTRSNQPVVCVDENYQTLPDTFETTQAVRIQPDDWPSYADQPWTTIQLARENPALAALVVEADWERLSLAE